MTQPELQDGVEIHVGRDVDEETRRIAEFLGNLATRMLAAENLTLSVDTKLTDPGYPGAPRIPYGATYHIDITDGTGFDSTRLGARLPPGDPHP